MNTSLLVNVTVGRFSVGALGELSLPVLSLSDIMNAQYLLLLLFLRSSSLEQANKESGVRDNGAAIARGATRHQVGERGDLSSFFLLFPLDENDNDPSNLYLYRYSEFGVLRV